ncbi:DUF4097 family beta strand repeat-containing protein [Luteimonas vadosa]|uniref:DUF4097 family beta strand repeat-containing protein n=1 Tax=Luteimonas vadosa TaxID=1165507 RepID=A0ABP9E8N3_9GAMM
MNRLPLLLLLTALCLPAWAATPIAETRALDSRGTVEIENLKGRIEVRSWDRPEVRLSGSLGNGVERLVVEGSGQRLSVKVKYPRNGRNTEPTTLILDVPTLASLDIESVSADVSVTGNAGRTLDIESVSGEVQAAGAPGKARFETVSGNQQLTLNSNDVSAESVSGRIRLMGRLGGEIQAENVSGDIDIDTRGERPTQVKTSSVSGDTSVRTGLANGGSIDVESLSGKVRLELPADLSARVRGESFSGRLSAPGASINKAKYGPGSDFDHRYGNGSGQVRIETFSGNAELVLR